MNLPAEMNALLLKGDGYAKEPSGTALEAMAPYVDMGRIAIPEPGDGQVLIKVAIAAINPSDVMFIKGMYGQPRHMGQPAGFEGVGEVVAAGGENGKGLIGKRVAFATGRSNWGSWADYAIAEASACIPLMPGISDSDGAAMIVNPLTALAMLDIVREEGEKAFVLSAAASQLCKLMMAAAKDAGLRPIAVVRRDDQGDILKAAGAAHVLNANGEEFNRQLAQVMRDEKPRIFLDAVAGPLSARIFDAMPKRARWIIYGKLDPATMPVLQPGQLIFMDKKIEGFWLTAWMRTVDPKRRLEVVMEAQKRFADGSWKTDVTSVVPLDEAMDRVAAELAKPNGKVFIKPGD